MLVSKQKLNQLTSSIQNNHITIVQGPSGSLKTTTIKTITPTFYIENHKRFIKHFNNDTLRTDIDNKNDIFKFITKFDGSKVIIETRCTITNSELANLKKRTKYSIEIVTFSALTETKMKKIGVLSNNLHKGKFQFGFESNYTVSFYHFLGKLFYKQADLKYLEYYEERKILSYVRQNFVYFLDDMYVLELISSNVVYVVEIVVCYINQAEKKRPNKFFGFNSLDEYTENAGTKFLFF